MSPDARPSRAGAQRRTESVTATSDDDELGERVLRVRATHAVGGVPVAVVREVVYRSLLDRRQPEPDRCAPRRHTPPA